MQLFLMLSAVCLSLSHHRFFTDDHIVDSGVHVVLRVSQMFYEFVYLCLLERLLLETPCCLQNSLTFWEIKLSVEYTAEAIKRSMLTGSIRSFSRQTQAFLRCQNIKFK